jgi:hypothetical protein
MAKPWGLLIVPNKQSMSNVPQIYFVVMPYGVALIIEKQCTQNSIYILNIGIIKPFFSKLPSCLM